MCFDHDSEPPIPRIAGAAVPWGEGHNSFGVVDAGTKWGLSEGRTGGGDAVGVDDHLAFVEVDGGVAVAEGR